MNSTDRLVFYASKFDRNTPRHSWQMYWLKVPQHIEFKLAVLAFHQSPADEARQRHRSASTSSLVVRPSRLSTIGNRAFPSLLEHFCRCGIVNICFRKRLKTHFFSHSFPQSPVVPVQCSPVTKNPRFLENLAKRSVQSFFCCFCTCEGAL